ncbi:MAG: CBS domain-containing protein [Pseudomonadota bacterium]
MNSYHELPFTSLATTVELPNTVSVKRGTVSLESSAHTVFTDFAAVRPATVRARTQIDVALEQMILLGIRLLFVVDQSGHLLGLVTSQDIMGEKPMLYLQTHDGQYNAITRAHIQVQDIMQLPSEWHAVDAKNIERAKLGDIVENFKKISGRHLLVVEQSEGLRAGLRVKGLFSATQLEQALGIEINTTVEPSHSFAEMEQILVAS